MNNPTWVPDDEENDDLTVRDIVTWFIVATIGGLLLLAAVGLAIWGLWELAHWIWR